MELHSFVLYLSEDGTQLPKYVGVLINVINRILLNALLVYILTGIKVSDDTDSNEQRGAATKQGIITKLAVGRF
jgi:hypothetical protein